MKNRRTFVLVPLAAVAVVLAFASVAYACTQIVGSISTTPSGPVRPGDTISSTASGLPAVGNTPRYWSLYFLNYRKLRDPMDTCMAQVPFSEQKIAGPVQQTGTSVSGSGQIPRTALPTNSTLGPARVCWIDSDSTVGVPFYNLATPPSEHEVVLV